MDYQYGHSERKKKPGQRSDILLDLRNSNITKELADTADRTAIKYLKDGEEEWLERRVASGTYAGISTGYSEMDSLMGSFLPGELFTIGGDTGHGKSLLAMNIAQNVYKQTMQSVLMVNLELTEDQCRERFYVLSGDEHDYAGIMIQAQPAVTYQDIDILMQKAHDEGACLVVIDHLHFFSRSAENSTQELSRIMKHFKECAVKNKLPIILLSHVTPTRVFDKDGMLKETRKPGLHNFKGSSSIEQDSDMVGFVFRDDEQPGEMKFYMRKNRSRPLDTRDVVLEQKDWKLIQTWPINLEPTPAQPNKNISEVFGNSELPLQHWQDAAEPG